MPTTSPDLPASVQSALDRGNRLEAIQVLRDLYGLDLKDSLEVIAGLRRLPVAAARPQEPSAHVVQTSVPQGRAGTQQNAKGQPASSLPGLVSRIQTQASQIPSARDTSRSGLAPGEVQGGSGVWELAAVLALVGAYFFMR